MKMTVRKWIVAGIALSALVYGDSELLVTETHIEARADGVWVPFEIVRDPQFGDPALVTPSWEWGMLGQSNRPLWKVYAGEFIETSDERVKENIQDLKGSDVLQKIKQVRPVSYAKKEIEGKQRGEREIGFLAQNVQKQFPEIVSYDEKSDSYGVKYSRAIPILLKAIQEQQKLLEQQAAQIEAIKRASGR